MIRPVLWASGSSAAGSFAEPIFREGRELSVMGHLAGDCGMAWDLFDEAAERERTGYLALMDEAEHEPDALEFLLSRAYDGSLAPEHLPTFSRPPRVGGAGT